MTRQFKVPVNAPGVSVNGTAVSVDGHTHAGGGGAPADATYVVTSSDGTLTNERVLTQGSYLTITDNGSSTVTIAVDATNANTASKVVARDASGNFSAGTVSATALGPGTALKAQNLGAAQSTATLGNNFQLDADTTLLRYTGSGAATLTGLAASGPATPAGGRTLYLANAGSGAITVAVQSSSSTAEYRISRSGFSSGQIATGEVGIFVYDATSSRWRLLGTDSSSVLRSTYLSKGDLLVGTSTASVPAVLGTPYAGAFYADYLLRPDNSQTTGYAWVVPGVSGMRLARHWETPVSEGLIGSDVSVVNSTTLTDVISVNLSANTDYEFEFRINLRYSATCDLKVALTGTAGINKSLIEWPTVWTGSTTASPITMATTPVVYADAFPATATSVQSGSSDYYVAARIAGRILTSTAGTLKFQIAQNSASSLVDVRAFAGSTLIYTTLTKQ